MAELNDPHVIGYAERIGKSLRADHYPNKLGAITALLIGSRYGVTVEGRVTTIKELSLLIASKLIK